MTSYYAANRERLKARALARYWLRRALGMCGACGKRPPRPRCVECAACARRRTAGADGRQGQRAA